MTISGIRKKCDRRHKNVEHQRRWTHKIRWKAEQRHQGKISARAAMAHGWIQHCHQKNQSQKKNFFHLSWFKKLQERQTDQYWEIWSFSFPKLLPDQSGIREDNLFPGYPIGFWTRLWITGTKARRKIQLTNLFTGGY